MTFGTPVFAGGTATSATVGSLSIILTHAIPSGDILAVPWGQGGSVSLTSVSDSVGQAWSIYNLAEATGGLGARWSGYAVAPLAQAMPAGGTITLGWSGSNSPACMALDIPVSGQVGYVDVAVGTAVTATSTSPSQSTGTLGYQNEICVGVIVNQNSGGSPTSPSWTAVSGGQEHASGQIYATPYYTLPGTATTSQTCDATVASSLWSVSVITFRGTPTSGGATLAGAGSVSALMTQDVIAALAGSGAVSALVTTGPGAVLAGAGSMSAYAAPQYGAALAGQGAVTAGVTQDVKAVLAGEGFLTAAPTPAADPVVTMIGAAGTFGDLADLTVTPTGHSFTTRAITGWAFGAGLCAFYTRATPDGQVIMSTIGFTLNELQPTEDHAELNVYDPAQEAFYSQVIPTSAGALTAVNPSTGLGGTDTGAGDVALVYQDGSPVILTTQDGYYFSWNIPDYGLYPALAFFPQQGGQWLYDQAISLTGDQWYDTNPTLYGDVIAPDGQSAGAGADYWSPKSANQMAVLPQSGNVVIGSYFGYGGTVTTSGGLSVVDPYGNLVAAYQIPAMTPTSGTLTLAAVRDVEADPTSVLNSEYFAIIYDDFGTGLRRTYQFFVYDQSSETIAPVSVPCCPGDDIIVGEFCVFAPDGTFYLTCGSGEPGLASLNAGNTQVYLGSAGSWKPVTEAPVYPGWETTSWPTPVIADYTLGFAVALSLGALGGPPVVDPVTGALLVPSPGTNLGITVPQGGGLGPNLLSTFASTLAPPNNLSVNDQVFATGLGTWTAFLGSTALNTTPPVAPPAGTHAMRVTEGLTFAIFSTGQYPCAASTPQQATVNFLAETVARVCGSYIQWYESDGVTVAGVSSTTSVTDSTTAYVPATVKATSPSNAAFFEIFATITGVLPAEYHDIAANSEYDLSAAPAGWTGFVTDVELAQISGTVWALAITAPFNDEALFASQAPVAVVPYQEYLVSAEFMAASGAPDQLCKVEVTWYDSGGTGLGVTACTMTTTDSASGFTTATCGAMAPEGAATGSVALVPQTTSEGETHYATAIVLQAQPYAAIPPVNYEIAGLRNIYSAVANGRGSIIGRTFYIPVATYFTSAESAAYNADPASYTPAPKPQFLIAVDLSQLLPPQLVGTWTATRAIGDGTGIPAPPAMPLECPVANSGDEGNGLVAFLGWTLPPGYPGADMAVTDDARNVWWPLGAPVTSSSAEGLTRSAIWACPGAFAAQNVYMSPCGLPGPVYPAVMGITAIEIADMSPYLGTPVTATASGNSAGTISAALASPGASAIQLAVASSDGTASLSGPGSAWTGITGVSASGGGYSLQTSPAWRVASAAGTATWTTAPADLSCAVAGILAENAAPPQPSADWPAFSFQVGLGAGALTPMGQIAWTDMTDRWLAGQETSAQAGKQYELNELEAADITTTLDDNDGALTADNPSSPYYPDVVTDIPARLIAWWAQRTYAVLGGYAERIPVNWDDTWYGMVKLTLNDQWAQLQNQLNAVLLEEMTWDPNLYSLWPCGDPQFISGNSSAVNGNPTLAAQNVAPGNTSSLQVVASKNGAVGDSPAQQFGADSGALPGDQSGSFWSQSGLTSGSEGYGWCLYCADQGYPLLSAGVTLAGWFSAAGATQVTNTAGPGGTGTLILMRGSNAGSGPAFQVFLESPVGSHPGAICVAVWDVSTGDGTVTTVYSGDWLTAGWFHVALEVTQSGWELFVNGTSAGSGSCNLPESISWMSYMGCADRFYTGSMLNGACGYLGVYGVLMPADRVQSIYLAGTPNPATVAGGATASRDGAQFGTEYAHFRIERLLGYGGWTGPRSVSQSSTTQMAPISDIQGDTAVIAASGAVSISSGGQEVSEAVGNITFSDGGFMFTDGNLALCYLSRGDLYAAPVQWTLGEDVQGGETPYLPSMTLGYDKSLLYNGAQLTPSVSVSGAPVTAVNLPSVRQHTQFVYNATAYQYLLAQIADEASWIVNTRGEVSLRAEQFTVDAMANPAAWPFLLRIQPATPVAVWRRPQLSDYSVEVFPLTAQVTKALDFEGGVATAQVTTDQFPEGGVLTVGDPVLGQANGQNPLAW